MPSKAGGSGRRSFQPKMQGKGPDTCTSRGGAGITEKAAFTDGGAVGVG